MSLSPQMMRMAGIAAAALAFSVLVLVPGQRKLKSARGKAQALLDTINVEATRYQSLDGLLKEVQVLRRGTLDFERRIPTEHQLGVFLADMARTLEMCGMENHILQPRPVHPISKASLPANCTRDFLGLQVQPVLVQCEGSFRGFFDTLAELEKQSRLSRVAWMKVTLDPNRAGRVKAEMQLDTYFLPPVANAGGSTP